MEKLVPCLDLCRRIPDGAFWNSALVWIFDTQCAGKKRPEFDEDARYFWVLSRDDAADVLEAERWGENPPCYPAPTVGEIIAELPYEASSCYVSIRPDRCGAGGKFSFPWQIGFHRDGGATFMFNNAASSSETFADLFLNMWFHIQGNK